MDQSRNRQSLNEPVAAGYRLNRRYFIGVVSAFPVLSWAIFGRRVTARGDAAPITYHAPYSSPFGEVMIRLRENVDDMQKALEFVYRNTTQNEHSCAFTFNGLQINESWLTLAVFSSTDHAFLGNALKRSGGFTEALNHSMAIPPGGLIGDVISLPIRTRQSGEARFDNRIPQGKILVQAIVRDGFLRSTLPFVKRAPGEPVDQEKAAKRSPGRWVRNVEIMRSNVLEIEN